MVSRHGLVLKPMLCVPYLLIGPDSGSSHPLVKIELTMLVNGQTWIYTSKNKAEFIFNSALEFYVFIIEK